MIVVRYKDLLTPKAPHKALVFGLRKTAGRNHHGRITTRHRGGGVKRLYRMVDFKQNKIGIPGRVEAIEYDPNRTAFIALVLYRDGERRYILAPTGLTVGAEIITDESAPLTVGNRAKLKNISVGSLVYNVEIMPGRGGSLVRSAGSGAEVLAHEGKYAHLKMPSGEIRMVLAECFASLGQVSNPENNLIVLGKAGKSRLRGRRPTVRGSAMNPRDHPYGGGEGRAQRGTRRPKTKWGKVTGGRKTRGKKKWSNAMIMTRRKTVRNP